MGRPDPALDGWLQRFAVDAIGTRPAMLARHGNRCGL